MKLALVSSDKQTMYINSNQASYSIFLKQFLDESNEGEEDEKICLPFSMKILSLMISFVNLIIEHPLEAPKETKINEHSTLSNMYGTKVELFFKDMEIGTLVELISASHYLNVEKLTTVCAAHFAIILKTMNPEEALNFFQIKEENEVDLTREELLRQKYKWLFEVAETKILCIQEEQ